MRVFGTNHRGFIMRQPRILTGQELAQLKEEVDRTFVMDRYGNLTRRKATRKGNWAVGTIDLASGYLRVFLLKRCMYVHRVVWFAKTGVYPTGNVKFKDGNITNVNFNNLMVD